MLEDVVWLRRYSHHLLVLRCRFEDMLAVCLMSALSFCTIVACSLTHREYDDLHVDAI